MKISDKDEQQQELIIALGGFSGRLDALCHESRDHAESTRAMNRIAERESERIAHEIDSLRSFFHSLLEVEVEGPF
eukprot:COSAG01_NODE_6702_length_3546_cov_3.445899_6_plen_76_part_00